MTEADKKFATELLQSAWHGEGPPISRYVLGHILNDLGTELRSHLGQPHGIIWHYQRYIDMATWLNTTREPDEELEPLIEHPTPLQRLRWWLFDTVGTIRRGVRGE